MDKPSKSKVNQMNLVVLAYVGDAVFSLYVRQCLALTSDAKSGQLTKLSNLQVKATAQSKSLEKIMPLLTLEEADIVRRARNSHTINKAKNAGLMDYKRATALEALFGYLHLLNQVERLNYLMEQCYCPSLTTQANTEVLHES